MGLIFIVPGLFCLVGAALFVAIIALVKVSRRPATGSVQAGSNAGEPASGGTIAIGDILGHLVPATGGPTITVVEGVKLGRQHLNPGDDAITRDDHVVFHKVVASAGTLVVAEILHTNGIEVRGVRHTSGRVQIADGATIKIGTTEFTFRKA